MKIILFITLITSLLFSQVSHATLLGDSIDGIVTNSFVPNVNLLDPGNGISPISATVGAGDEFFNSVSDAILAVDFGDDRLRFSLGNSSTSSSPNTGSFVVDFTSLDWQLTAGRITDLNIFENTFAGLTFSFTDDSIHFEIPDFSIAGREIKTVAFDIVTEHTPVPVPSAAWLLATGFAGLFRMRKK